MKFVRKKTTKPLLAAVRDEGNAVMRILTVHKSNQTSIFKIIYSMFSIYNACVLILIYAYYTLLLLLYRFRSTSTLDQNSEDKYNAKFINICCTMSVRTAFDANLPSIRRKVFFLSFYIHFLSPVLSSRRYWDGDSIMQEDGTCWSRRRARSSTVLLAICFVGTSTCMLIIAPRGHKRRRCRNNSFNLFFFSLPLSSKTSSWSSSDQSPMLRLYQY